MTDVLTLLEDVLPFRILDDIDQYMAHIDDFDGRKRYVNEIGIRYAMVGF